MKKQKGKTEKASNNWAHRRKIVLDKLGDNILHSAEENALTRQNILRNRLIEEIAKEVDGLEGDNLKETLIKAFIKPVPVGKPIAVMINIAIEKLAKKISEPVNPF